MTLTLILTRHAKSCWKDTTLNDHDRPLNKRGVRSGRAIGAWLRQKGYLPDQCLVSPAARAQSTCTLIQRALPPMQLCTMTALYMATAVDMMHALAHASARRVLVIGHNPGMMYFAHGLAANWPDHPGFEDYPTAATTVIEFKENRWEDVPWKSGRVVDFVVPRELMQEPHRR